MRSLHGTILISQVFPSLQEDRIYHFVCDSIVIEQERIMAKFVRVGSIQFSAFADLQRGEPESMEKVLRMTRKDLDSL